MYDRIKVTFTIQQFQTFLNNDFHLELANILTYILRFKTTMMPYNPCAKIMLRILDSMNISIQMVETEQNRNSLGHRVEWNILKRMSKSLNAFAAMDRQLQCHLPGTNEKEYFSYVRPFTKNFINLISRIIFKHNWMLTARYYTHNMWMVLGKE